LVIFGADEEKAAPDRATIGLPARARAREVFTQFERDTGAEVRRGGARGKTGPARSRFSSQGP
jgi:hypothetical protein